MLFTRTIFLLPFQLLFCFWVSAQNNYPNLELSPRQPQAGYAIKFAYDLGASNLRNAQDIKCYVLEFSGDEPVSLEPMLNREGNKIFGTFVPSKNAQMVAFAFYVEEDIWDNNNGDGFFIQMCDESSNILPESYVATAVFMKKWGRLMDLNRNSDAIYEMLEKGTPTVALKQKHRIKIAEYAPSSLGDRGRDNTEHILIDISKDSVASESDCMAAIRLYNKGNKSKESDKLKEQVRKRFPNGELVRQERRTIIESEPEISLKIKGLQQYILDFFPKTAQEMKDVVGLRVNIAEAYAEAKNYESFMFAAAECPIAMQASLLNNAAWDLAEKNETPANIDLALQMADKAFNLAIENNDFPVYLSAEMKDRERYQTASNYGDTYAFVLSVKGRLEEAVNMQDEAVAGFQEKNTALNERLVDLLAKTDSPMLIDRLAQFIRKGNASAKMKSQYKQALIQKQKMSEKKAGEALAALEKEAYKVKLANLSMRRLARNAPRFSLQNLEGQTVTLESLRGKTIVVDFWATWCGPCKASFPAMKMAVEKYAKNPEVAFVFINTWEKATDKTKNAQDFISEKQYPFNVLMDTGDNAVTAFGVSGIPTKYIIDKSGVIRFKSVGFGGDNDQLLEELQMMLELAELKQ